MPLKISAITPLKALFIASTVALAAPGLADSGARSPDYVVIPLASHHFGDWGKDGDKDFNEFNPGLMFTWAERGSLDLNYTAGMYKDSRSDAALHLSAAKMWDIGTYTQAGIVGGYIHSFGDGYTGFAPSLQLNYKYMFVNIATGYDDDVYGVVSTGLTFPLGR